MYRNDRAHERRLQASYAKTRVALIDYNLYVSRGSLACTRVFLARFSFSPFFLPLEGGEKRKEGKRKVKEKKMMRWYERSFSSASVALLARPARSRTAPRIDLSIVFERRRWRLPQTFVYKREYRSSYRRLERLNELHTPRSTLHYVRLFSPPRIG